MHSQKNVNKKKNVKRLGKVEQLGDIVNRRRKHNDHYRALWKEVEVEKEVKNETEKKVQNYVDASHE